MPMRFPTINMDILLIGDGGWQTEWGIEYVLDRVQSYGNKVVKLTTMGSSIPVVASEKYAQKNNIPLHSIKESNNWYESILLLDTKPTHVFMFANHILQDPFTNMMTEICIINDIKVCRAVDYICYFCFEILVEKEEKEKQLKDIPYFYNNSIGE